MKKYIKYGIIILLAMVTMLLLLTAFDNVYGTTIEAKKQKFYTDLIPGTALVVDTFAVTQDPDTATLSDSLTLKHNAYGCNFGLITETYSLANACTLEIYGTSDGGAFTDTVIHTTSGIINADTLSYHSVHRIRILGYDANDSVCIRAWVTNIKSFINSDSLSGLTASQFLRSDVADTGTYISLDSLDLKKLIFGLGSKGDWGIIKDTTKYTLSIQYRPSGTPAAEILIDSLGNVGIGTAVPSEKLDVIGNAKADTFIGTATNSDSLGNQSLVDVQAQMDDTATAVFKRQIDDFQATIVLPKTLADTITTVFIKRFYYDVNIHNLWMRTLGKTSYSVVFESWNQCDSVVAVGDTLKKVATATTVCADSVVNCDVDSGQVIMVRLPTTYTKELQVGGVFTRK